VPNPIPRFPVIDLRPINAILGILIAILGTMMLVPAIVDLVSGDPDWLVFVVSAGVTVFVGSSLWLAGRQEEPAVLSVRQAFLLTALSWIVLSGFGALPFMWSAPDLNFARAYFETVSGLTTTGASVISDLDTMPPGILLWRSLLQWYGGIGIIVFAIAVLPMLQIGGMQLFRTESSDKSEKFLPRIGQIANRIIVVYVTLTVTCAVLYAITGMDLFDAVNHAMTTISTGGFSTHDGSFGHFANRTAEYIAVVFMIAGSLPMVLLVRAFAGDFHKLWVNPEVRLFLAIIAVFTVASTLQQRAFHLNYGEESFRLALFNVTSLITTTGFAAVDYAPWGALSDALYFLVMFLGGCTGSTTGGLKMFRLLVLASAVRQHLRRVIYPNGVFPIRFGATPVTDDVAASVMSFLFFYIASFFAVGLIINMMGFDLRTSFSAAVAAVANVGPGLGPLIGPAGTYGPMNDTAIWLLSFAMLVGRLEIFTVFVLFLPQFWRP
jgi:trk system potassium uptake protein TrkH